jgi:hypothetical protein
MARLGSLRSLVLAGVSMVALGVVATASAGAGSPGDSAQQPSSSPHVGEPLRASSPDQHALSDHLRRRGARFFGAWWCPACFQQKNLFGKEAGNSLPYVECDRSDAGRARCRAAGIQAFPTWELPGRPRLEGVQSLEELKTWSQFRAAQGPAR